MSDDLRGALRLHEAATRHGACCFVERRLFALTGAWAAAPGHADGTRLHLFEASAAHAWHAQLFADRLPVLAGWDRDALVRPTGDALAAALDALAPPGSEGPGAPAADATTSSAATAAAGFMAGLYRVVLPRLVAAYRRHGARLVDVADRPAIRALAIVVRDEEEELAAGEALAAAATTDPGAARRAAQMQSNLEAILAAGGATDELFSWSDDVSGGP